MTQHPSYRVNLAARRRLRISTFEVQEAELKMERFAEVISIRFLSCEFGGPLRISTLISRVEELKRITFSEFSCNVFM